jgi:molybdopterin converting factor small subunit
MRLSTFSALRRDLEHWEYAEWICTYTENTRNARNVEYLDEFETKI